MSDCQFYHIITVQHSHDTSVLSWPLPLTSDSITSTVTISVLTAFSIIHGKLGLAGSLQLLVFTCSEENRRKQATEDYLQAACSSCHWLYFFLLFSALEVFLTHGTIIIFVHNNTYTHTFNSPFSGTTRVSRYQKEKPR